MPIQVRNQADLEEIHILPRTKLINDCRDMWRDKDRAKEIVDVVDGAENLEPRQRLALATKDMWK